MGRIQGQCRRYRSDGNSWIPSLALNMRLGSLVCLMALLALNFLPAVHQGHLLFLEKCNPTQAAGSRPPEAGLSLSEPDPYKAERSPHNTATCPICQAESICRHFSAPALSLSPILALWAQQFCESAFPLPLANPELLTSGSRAPPTFL